MCPKCGSMLQIVVYDDEGDGTVDSFICAECFLSEHLGRSIESVPTSRILSLGSKHIKRHAESYLGITRAAHRETVEDEDDS